MKDKSTVGAFYALLRTGLWGANDNLNLVAEVDWGEVYRLAEEQSVVGVIAAGIEAVQGRLSVPKEWALQFIGQTLQLEQRNKAMNGFVAKLINGLRKAGVYGLLVKGQGVAQCYEKPLWRSCGDVDLFLSDDNYVKAKEYLTPLASSVETEGEYNKHLGLTIDEWVVELHGHLYGGLSSRIDHELDNIQRDTFYNWNVRSCVIDHVQVFMLSAENDAFYVFTHILQHFFKGGIGVRQICDWCRLLWTYRDKLDVKALESRIRKAGLMSEWKAFGAFAVEYLGMPACAVPLLNDNLNDNENLKRKADRICEFILMSGNFGHNRDNSFYKDSSYLRRKTKSFGRRLGDMWNHLRIFPIDTLRFFPKIVYNGLRSAANGE